MKSRAIMASIWLVGCIPLSVLRVIGASLATAAYWLNIREVKTTRTNLQVCFAHKSEKEIEALTKTSFTHMGMLSMEMFKVITRGEKWAKKHVLKIHGQDVLARILSQEKGVLFLGPHLGNWEVVPNILPSLGKTTILYQKPKQANFEPVIVAHRARQGATVVPTTQKGVATVLKALRKGEIVGVLPDQVPTDEGGEYAPFYSTPAYTMTFVQKLLNKTGCPAIFMFVERVQGGFHIHYRDVPEAIYSTDSQESLTALNKGVEDCIAQCVVQYQWEYKRFKKQPDGKQPYID